MRSALALALLVAGCAGGSGALRSFSAPAKPEVELSSLAATFASSEEGRFDLALTVHQPSWLGAKAIGLTWEAWIDRQLFASGRVALNALPLDGSCAVPIALSLPVIYRHLEYRVGPTRILLRFRGSLEMQRGPSTWLRDFERTEEISAEGAPIPAGGLDSEH